MKKPIMKHTKHPTWSGLLVLIIGYGCAFILNLLHYGTSDSLLDTTLRFSVIAIVSTGASLILSPFLKKLKVKGAKYLQVQIKHTFPIVQNQGIYYRSSSLARGVEDHIGLLWAESTNRPQSDTKIHFFQVYLQSETMIHTDISWESWVNNLLLQYDTDGKRWIACLDYLALYQVELQQEPRFTELTETTPEYHSAPLHAILLNQWQNPHRHTNYTEVGGQQHGGLFWFDYNGQCLQQSTSRVGAQISMCCCGERIIGVDHIPERWRVWTWLPTDTQEIQECLILDTTITRATVVAQSGEDEPGGFCFWLVEEYEHGVKVSLRADTTCAERATTWLEGITLPDGPYGRYLYSQRKPAGVLPYNGTLLLLGFDKQKQLTLFQISV